MPPASTTSYGQVVCRRTDKQQRAKTHRLSRLSTYKTDCIWLRIRMRLTQAHHFPTLGRTALPASARPRRKPVQLQPAQRTILPSTSLSTRLFCTMPSMPTLVRFTLATSTVLQSSCTRSWEIPRTRSEEWFSGVMPTLGVCPSHKIAHV
jgi:hypothetical protein